jgi:hypothetical protein
MHILALSDIHNRTEILKKLVEQAKDFQLVLIAGDLTNYGPVERAEEALCVLEGTQVFAVPGNLDSWDVARYIERKGVSIHGKEKEVCGIHILGFGGGLKGNVGEVLFDEQEIASELLKAGIKPDVLVTHLPPYGSKLDKVAPNTHIGSRAVREAIERIQPRLHICGHAHECYGEEKIGNTLCINVAAVKEGRAVLIDVDTRTYKWLEC